MNTLQQSEKAQKLSDGGDGGVFQDWTDTTAAGTHAGTTLNASSTLNNTYLVGTNLLPQSVKVEYDGHWRDFHWKRAQEVERTATYSAMAQDRMQPLGKLFYSSCQVVSDLKEVLTGADRDVARTSAPFGI
mmetsp:Transcript_80456/g.126859  ORF Transcript_80456/g.126859 Transcript_80456/m.126859 type:complete len:131 (+) Transcript_80456:86-478(+)